MSIQLMAETGPLAGKYWVYDEAARIVVGRDAGVDIPLPGDASASRRHACLAITPPDVRLRDLGSLNGLFVNGRHHPPSPGGGDVDDDEAVDWIVLAHGDRVQIGLSMFRVFVPYCRECGEPIEGPFANSGVLRCPDCEPERGAAASASGRTLAGALMPGSGGTDGGARADGLSVLQRLSRGAMGEVFLARREADGMLVTVKAIRRMNEAPGEVEAFLRRVASFKECEHPNLVRLFDGGAAGRQWFLVREYVPGWTLDGWRLAHPKKRLALAEFLPFMRQALSGLAYSHTRGHVHRQLQPGHVFLDASRPEPLLKLADPDLAVFPGRGGHDSLLVDAVTGGHTAYVAPEQAGDLSAGGPAADVFALAATFCVALTGAPVYDFSDAEADPLSVLLEGRIVPVASRGADLPSRLVSWLDHALSLDPSSRFPDAVAMRAAFKALELS